MRPGPVSPEALRAAMCKSYADGTRSALESVVEGLRALPPDTTALEAAAELQLAMPGLLAQQRRLFAEQAGVEL